MDASSQYHKSVCTNLPEDEHLDGSKHVKDIIIKLKHYCKTCVFCWFLLHRNITTHS